MWSSIESSEYRAYISASVKGISIDVQITNKILHCNVASASQVNLLNLEALSLQTFDLDRLFGLVVPKLPGSY